jgi:integrase
VPFHALRHSAASALLGAGLSLKAVSDQLGHSTIVLTANTYGHLTPDARDEAAQAMDRVLGAEA